MKGWFVENLEEMAAVSEMEAIGDRAAAIVIASFIEARLTKTLQAAMRDDLKIKSELFRSAGPLGSFSAKTDLAFLLGLISSQAHRDLVTMRRVRNIFAHQFKATAFTDDQIRALCQNLKLIESQCCDMDTPEENQPAGFRFHMKVEDYALLLSEPRGRYMLTGRLFVAGLDNMTRERTLSPDDFV